MGKDKSGQAKQLILVDGSSYLYRAFHAMPNLTNSRSEPTGAVYGITNMIRKLLADYEPQYIAVVFDAKGKTFRNDLYKEYKANRPPMPDELRKQIERTHDVIKAMGLPLLVIDGVEADDVIGTLATQASKKGMDTLISSGDKDMAQLIDGHVRMVDTMKDVVYDDTEVENKFGVGPDRIIDFLALVGDTSDNIPGVPKVGPKTAAKWLNEYGSLDGVITHADDIGGKVGENLRASLKQIPLSRQLATIKCDVALERSPKQLKRTAPDEDRLRELYSDLEFKTWLSELGGVKASSTYESSAAEYETLFDEAQLDDWLERLKASELFAFDTETTSLQATQAQLVGLSFAIEAGAAAYLPVGHNYPGAPAQLSLETVLAKMKPVLEDANQAKVGQNLKYDMSVLANYDIELRGIKFDTMLESYVLDSVASRHDMDSLALKYLGETTIKFEDVAGKGKNQLGFNEVAIEDATPYAAEDAEITLRLHENLWPRLQQVPTLVTLFETLEMPLLPVLSRVERNGVRIDVDMLRKQSQELATRMLEVEAEAYEIAGQPFNMASPKQIQEILFDKLGLPVLRKTPKGQPSTAEEVLQELALDYPLPERILEHRGLAKLKSTYTDKLPEMVDPNTGRVHTSYHQAVAATGRLSSSDPNLQNIPVRKAGESARPSFLNQAS